MILINKNNEIEIYGVVPIRRGNRIIKFITSVSIADIGEVYNRLIYDENTQRGYKITKKGNKEIQEKIINKDNIEEMKDKILSGFFDGGHLVWNVRINYIGNEKQYYEYIPQECKLIIKSNYITLPDSAQRHIALNDLSSYVSIDTKNYFLPLDICFYTFEEEQSLFSEINGCGQKANKTRSLFLSNIYKTQLLKRVIDNSLLKGKVEDKFARVMTNDSEKIVTFATLYDSLFDKTVGAFKQMQEDEIEEIERWLIKFYNALFEIRSELNVNTLDEKLLLKDTTLSLQTVMFFAYAHVAKALKNDENWKRKLKRLNNTYKYGSWEGDFFSTENPLWHNTVCYYEEKNKVWRSINSNRTRSVVIREMLKYLNLV